MPPLRDLTGQRFGRLVVLARDGSRAGAVYWLCRCDCGNKKTAASNNLKGGYTRSCGCLRREVVAALGRKQTTHGHLRRGKATALYLRWRNILDRCMNPRNKQYADYGGRGITVCKKWRKFQNFLTDMGEPPPGYQIDRIDNNKGYCKSNCRWVSRKSNLRNKRSNHFVTFCGRTQCLAVWAEETGIPAQRICRRLREGWSVERALSG